METDEVLKEADAILSQRRRSQLKIDFPPPLTDWESWEARQRWALSHSPQECLELLRVYGPYCDLVRLLGYGED